MKTKTWLLIALTITISFNTFAKKRNATFPDGSPVESWFNDTTHVDVNKLGKKYVITDYGVKSDSTLIQTEAIQKVIDTASADGGGVIVIPRGTFLSGSLFFKQGTHLHLDDGATLKGIDTIKYYAITRTRLEGQMINYFAALVNANGVDGFTISGNGTINGNGKKFWEEFWLRRKVNPKCTNLEALRPRLIYISNSKDVTVSDVNIINSGFWTNHIYHCNKVKFIGCHIFAPTRGEVKAPSSDGIDIDWCSNVLIHGCYMNVNDDGVCLKGGKGTFVDKDSTSGPVRNIIVEKCHFNEANGGITFGSEAFDCSNVIMRDCVFNGTSHLLLFKMRPDTPQSYQYVLAENLTGTVIKGIEISPWTQFYNLLKRDDMPETIVSHVTMRNINVKCTKGFYQVRASEKYKLSDFSFENISAQSADTGFDTSIINGCQVKDVKIDALK